MNGPARDGRGDVAAEITDRPARRGQRVWLPLWALAGALTATLAFAGAAAAASCPAGTVVRGADSIDGRLTRVLSADRMTCSAARKVVSAYGGLIAAPGAYQRGGRYYLGRFACRVTAAPAGRPVRARCARGTQSFRVAYRYP
ncbi:MAG: hypothetical protein AB7I08_08700 [Thermoleophilia bacterium]